MAGCMIIQAFPLREVLGIKLLACRAEAAIANGLTDIPPPRKLAIPGRNVVIKLPTTKNTTSCKQIPTASGFVATATLYREVFTKVLYPERMIESTMSTSSVKSARLINLPTNLSATPRVAAKRYPTNTKGPMQTTISVRI